MWTTIAKIAIQVLAGVGLGELADKILPDKVPAYPTGGVLQNLSLKNIPKIIGFIIVFVISALALRFLGRKFRIKLLK